MSVKQKNSLFRNSNATGEMSFGAVGSRHSAEAGIG